MGRSATVALAVQADHGGVCQVEVPCSQVGDLLGPGAGVVEEQQQGVVAPCQPAGTGKVGQQILHLVEFEELRLRGWGPFHRDGGYLLAGLQHLRFPAGDVLEQCVQGGQALVAGPDVIVAFVFQVAQEAQDLLVAEIGQFQLGDLDSLRLRQVAQQQPDGVAVAAH